MSGFLFALSSDWNLSSTLEVLKSMGIDAGSVSMETGARFTLERTSNSDLRKPPFRELDARLKHSELK